MATAKVPPVLGERKASRFSQPCKVCSKWILHGQTVEYMKAGWAHPSIEECVKAPASIHGLPWATDEERDSQPFYQRLQRLAMVVRAQKWTYAKSMPQSPHYWAVRQKWQGGVQGFYDLTSATRTMGQIQKFGRTDYHILNINEHRYWSMEARHAPPEASELINRAVRLKYEPEPEPWFDANWGWWSEGVERFMIDQMTEYTARVLDVGGTCPSVARVAAEGYRAIGTPGDMTRLLAEVSTARTMHTEVEHFAPTVPEPFDMAIVGFGAGAQLTRRDILRLQYMTSPKGRVIVQMGTKVQPTDEVVTLLENDGVSATVGAMARWTLEGLWQPSSDVSR